MSRVASTARNVNNALASTSHRAAPQLQPLINTLASLKGQSRRPTVAAYLALIKGASDYSIRRGAENGQLGWQIALGAWQDAQLGRVELGSAGLDQMLKVIVIGVRSFSLQSPFPISCPRSSSNNRKRSRPHPQHINRLHAQL
jgi:hypothetical protein